MQSAVILAKSHSKDSILYFLQVISEVTNVNPVSPTLCFRNMDSNKRFVIFHPSLNVNRYPHSTSYTLSNTRSAAREMNLKLLQLAALAPSTSSPLTHHFQLR